MHNSGLPDNLDYKIVIGYEGSNSVDVVLFDTAEFEKTGCEYESEVFRVTISNLTGLAEYSVLEGDKLSDGKLFDKRLETSNHDTFAEWLSRVKSQSNTKPPNCS